MLVQTNLKYLGFGSPLMDIIADIDLQIIKKYDLKLDETIHKKMSETNIFSILEREAEVTYVPGGCSYNTMRVFNFMLQEENSVGVLGSVGMDKYGSLYSQLLTQEGITPLFEEFSENNTGVCAVYCYNRDRGHVTDLGASTQISAEFVCNVWDELKDAELIFTELFILKHRKNVVHMLAELGGADRKIFGFNLPSFYFIETFLEDIKSLIEFADIIFANAAEATFLGTLLGIENPDNLAELCQHLAKLPKKNKTKNRTIVITCGPNPAHICDYDFSYSKNNFTGLFTPEFVPEESIIDTNGAGDAFAGGFLSKYVKGKSLAECMKAGHWAAALIIQTRGCQIPDFCEYIK